MTSEFARRSGVEAVPDGDKEKAEPQAKRESAWRLVAVALGWVALAVGGAVLFGGVTGVFVAAVGGPTSVKSEGAVLLYTFMGSLGAASVLLISARVRGRIVGNGDISAGLGNQSISRWAIMVLLAALVAGYALGLSVAGYKARPDMVPRLFEISPWLYAFFVFLGVFVSPLSEELFLRGWLWTGLMRHWGPFFTALLTSGLWLAMHAEWGVARIIALVPLAVILPTARYFGRSVRATIALHAIYNLVNISGSWVLKVTGVI